MLFYRDFAAAYGTFWLVVMAIAIVGQTHVDTGAFGAYGFPAIALLYAMIQKSQRKD